MNKILLLSLNRIFNKKKGKAPARDGSVFFFVPDGEGGNEKYIKSEKTTFDSEIISNFAVANEKQKNTKREYYEIHNVIDDYHYGLRHLLRLSDHPRPVLCERQYAE